MPKVVLKKADVAKAAWQSKRPKELKNSGVGKALEAFKPHFTSGWATVFKSGKTDEAQKAGLAVTKALGVARQKAGRIREQKEKQAALDLVKGYETLVATFQSNLLSAQEKIDEKRRQVEAEREAQRKRLGKKDYICSNNTYMVNFIQFCKDEQHSGEEATAAVLWEKKEYKQATQKFGPNNQWNQHAVTTRQLLAHFDGSEPLNDQTLGQLITEVRGGFNQMVWGLSGMQGRYLKSDTLQKQLEKDFPG